MEDTLNTVEKNIHKFIKDVPQTLVNSGLDIDLDKLNIDDGQKDLVSLFPKSLTDEINKGILLLLLFFFLINYNILLINIFIIFRGKRKNFSFRAQM